MFSLTKQVELTEEKFLGKKTILVSNFKMEIQKSTNQKVEFGQLYDQDETLFENIDVSKNAVGSIWDDVKETHMVFVQNGLVYVIDLVDLDKIDFEQIMDSEFS